MANYGSQYRMDANFNEGLPLVGPSFKVNHVILNGIETITVDKWFNVQENPILRKVLSAAILAGSLFFVDSESLKAGPNFPSWNPPTNQRLVPTLPRQHTGEFRFEVPRTVLLSDWFQPASEPVRRKPTQLLGGESRFEVPRTVLLSDWYQQASEPLKQKTRQVLGGDTRTDIVAASEIITVDKWYQLPSQPYFTKRRDPNTGEFRFELPRTILLSDWFQPQSQPYFSKFRDSKSGDVRVEIENITIDKWFRETSQPFFTKLRNANTGEFRFELPRTILLTDWHNQLPEPVRRKQVQLLGGETRTDIVSPVEIITVDKWYQLPNQPYFSKLRNPHFGDVRVEIENISLDKWYREIVQPFFTKRRDSNFGEFRFELPRDIVVTDWFKEITQPYFSKLRNSNFGEYRFELPEDVSESVLMSEWYKEIIQPFFSKYRNSNVGEFRVDVIATIVSPPDTGGSPDQIGSKTEDVFFDRRINELILEEDSEIMLIIQAFLTCR